MGNVPDSADEADTLLIKWGSEGSGDGEFGNPCGIAVGGEGQVYVADYTKNRIQVFDSEGQFLWKWGERFDWHGLLAMLETNSPLYYHLLRKHL